MTDPDNKYRLTLILERHGDDGWAFARDQAGCCQFITFGSLEECTLASENLNELLRGLSPNGVSHLCERSKETDDD